MQKTMLYMDFLFSILYPLSCMNTNVSFCLRPIRIYIKFLGSEHRTLCNAMQTCHSLFSCSLLFFLGLVQLFCLWQCAIRTTMQTQNRLFWSLRLVDYTRPKSLKVFIISFSSHSPISFMLKWGPKCWYNTVTIQWSVHPQLRPILLIDYR